MALIHIKAYLGDTFAICGMEKPNAWVVDEEDASCADCVRGYWKNVVEGLLKNPPKKRKK